MNNWTPVTEQLPKTGRKVLATFENEVGNRRRICAFYVRKGEVESNGYEEAYDYYD